MRNENQSEQPNTIRKKTMNRNPEAGPGAPARAGAHFALMVLFGGILSLFIAFINPIQAAPRKKQPASPKNEKQVEAPKSETKDESAPAEGGHRQPEEMVRIFLDIYKTRGGASAVDYIYSNNPVIFEKKEHMGNMKEKLNRLPEVIGKNCGEILIQDRTFKGTIRIITYLVKHERQPLRFTFVFYKPTDRWITYQFGYDDALNEETIKEAQRLRLESLVE